MENENKLRKEIILFKYATIFDWYDEICKKYRVNVDKLNI